MPYKRVIYNAEQTEFFKDVLLNRVADKMLDAATALNVYPNQSEIASWRNNAPKIKNLIELSGIQNTYVTFEYLVPYYKKRIDCVIYAHKKIFNLNITTN